MLRHQAKNRKHLISVWARILLQIAFVQSRCRNACLCCSTSSFGQTLRACASYQQRRFTRTPFESLRKISHESSSGQGWLEGGRAEAASGQGTKGLANISREAATRHTAGPFSRKGSQTLFDRRQHGSKRPL